MGARERLRTAMEAIRLGALPADAALRAALEGPRAFDGWVRQHQASWSTEGERRSALVRRPTATPSVIGSALRRARRGYGRAGNLSIHWGLVRKQGRSSGTPGVIVVVDRKLPRAMVPARELIARWIDVPSRSRRAWARVDVQAAGEPGALQLGVRPANHASVQVGKATGALGAIVEDDGDLG